MDFAPLRAMLQVPASSLKNKDGIALAIPPLDQIQPQQRQ